MPQESGNILKKSKRDLQISDKIKRLYGLVEKHSIEPLCLIFKRDTSNSEKIFFYQQCSCLVGGVNY